MTLTLPVWLIPTALTALVWVAAIFWPKGRTGGDYNFMPAILAAFHGLLAIIATLLVWLAYLTVRVAAYAGPAA